MHEWKSFSEQSFFCNQILISGLNLKHNLKSCNLQCKPWGKIKSCCSRGYKKVAKGSRFKTETIHLDSRAKIWFLHLEDKKNKKYTSQHGILTYFWHPNFLAGHNWRVSEVLKCIWNLAIILTTLISNNTDFKH